MVTKGKTNGSSRTLIYGSIKSGYILTVSTYLVLGSMESVWHSSKRCSQSRAGTSGCDPQTGGEISR